MLLVDWCHCPPINIIQQDKVHIFTIHNSIFSMHLWSMGFRYKSMAKIDLILRIWKENKDSQRQLKSVSKFSYYCRNPKSPAQHWWGEKEEEHVRSEIRHPSITLKNPCCVTSKSGADLSPSLFSFTTSGTSDHSLSTFTIGQWNLFMVLWKYRIPTFPK